jgi:Protein of unknown function (DUF2934)
MESVFSSRLNFIHKVKRFIVETTPPEKCFKGKTSKFQRAMRMSFIQQQIESFLNLGGCKEYLIMPKLKFPGSKAKKDTASNPTPEAVAQQMSPSIVPPSTAPETGRDGATKAEAKKLEIVKSDSRATVRPINLEQEIRRRAYELSEKRGFSSGHETEDWLAAEQEVLGRYNRQQSA